MGAVFRWRPNFARKAMDYYPAGPPQGWWWGHGGVQRGWYRVYSLIFIGELRQFGPFSGPQFWMLFFFLRFISESMASFMFQSLHESGDISHVSWPARGMHISWWSPDFQVVIVSMVSTIPHWIRLILKGFDGRSASSTLSWLVYEISLSPLHNWQWLQIRVISNYQRFHKIPCWMILQPPFFRGSWVWVATTLSRSSGSSTCTPASKHSKGTWTISGRVSYWKRRIFIATVDASILYQLRVFVYPDRTGLTNILNSFFRPFFFLSTISVKVSPICRENPSQSHFLGVSPDMSGKERIQRWQGLSAWFIMRIARGGSICRRDQRQGCRHRDRRPGGVWGEFRYWFWERTVVLPSKA